MQRVSTVPRAVRWQVRPPGKRSAASGVGRFVKVEIWSDVVCPWCYIGKRRFEKALAGFAHRDRVEVEWRAFELDPSAVSAPVGAPPAPGAHARHLAAKMGRSQAEAQQMLDSMAATAAVEGLDFRFDRAVAANTVDAHQVIHLGGLRGVQDAVKERLLRAYFTEGAALGERATLVRLATEAGLDAGEAAAVLEGGTFVDAVRSDEAQAHAYGITGVPFFVVDERYGVAGAQPAEQLLAVLEQAWSERPLTMVGADPAGAGAAIDDASGACGPDGCAI
jgi:predicted DsbA family dithiol-disulfide isomerase